MSKHSKGPWTWAVHPSHGDDSEVMESLIAADGGEVLWLGDSAWYDQRSGYEPEPADKALIKVSPLLLEALEHIENLIARDRNDDIDATMLRALIAKARGEA